MQFQRSICGSDKDNVEQIEGERIAKHLIRIFVPGFASNVGIVSFKRRLQRFGFGEADALEAACMPRDVANAQDIIVHQRQISIPAIAESAGKMAPQRPAANKQAGGI